MALGRALVAIGLVGALLPGRWGGGSAAGAPLWREGRVEKERLGAASLPDFSRVAERARAAVVSIATVQQSEIADLPLLSRLAPKERPPEVQRGLGAGFLIHPDGFFVTNGHVIDGAAQVVVTVRREGRPREYQARLLGLDRATDIALMRLDSEGEQFPTLPLGDSDRLQVAEWIAVLGNPYGLFQSISVGVVSYVGRTDVSPAGRDGYFDYVQTDAPINPGNSGGPLIDLSGEVVAIANAVNAVGQGIGFAIPINMAKRILGPLFLAGRVERSWLGVGVDELTSESAERLGLPLSQGGVLITEVGAQTPAARAGLKVGDVLTAFDGAQVDDAQRLRWLSAMAGVGHKAELVAMRGGQPMKLSAKLEAMPEERKLLLDPRLSELGLVVSEVDVPTARSAGLALPFGACVKHVREGSRAWRAGLREGDLILKVDEREVRSPSSLARALGGAAPLSGFGTGLGLGGAGGAAVGGAEGKGASGEDERAGRVAKVVLRRQTQTFFVVVER